ncbi:3'-5' exonuclease [Corynebacterium falsenii]|uniref:exonuclease domain-containing protein n=1 Tax=Corynebacterium falsenii TaxID=108486 RepID=UPI001CCC1E0B|nr:exonuclease domain-containing protein [Corynebacterium falsenii]UBI05906.1 3'-5' exonuclease [Corynebacterium falsenii]
MGWLDALTGKSTRKATGPLADYYAATAPGPDTPLDELPMLAVDVETTGLNPAKDRILSIGWVPIDGRVITLGGAAYHVVKPESGDGSVGHSATIHGLTDDDVATGRPLSDVLGELLAALAGRAMLVHYEPIEREFLTAACRKLYGSGLKVPTVDTLEIERRHMERMATFPRGEDLRLPRIRQRYGLPAYGSHNALGDALATAELYLVLADRANGHTLRAMQVR